VHDEKDKENDGSSMAVLFILVRATVGKAEIVVPG